ncbi:MAG: glycosyltransferase family 4 protein [Bacteroides sp.]|nr:glycosyltransferase family 4 protein [Bacteroides sp.]
MKVLLINTFERTGGAAIACSRLMEALKSHGITVRMLVRDKQTNKLDVIPLERGWLMVWRFVWERICIWKSNRFNRHNLFAVDIANTGTDITSLPEFQQADVIHLHWVNQGMLSLGDISRILRSGKPVVWTMHDLWSATGICHYPGPCRRYTQECGHCHLLYKCGHAKDLSWRTFRKKKTLYQGRSVTFVACSQWLKGMAEKSALLQGQRIVSIPNAINTNLFRPADKRQARDKFGLPHDRKLILFGALKTTDPRKGVDYLVEACRLLAEKHPELKEQVGIVTFGKQAEELKTLFPFASYPVQYLTNEHQLADIYNAVDLYVTPSLEDNLPNTIMEAMACGTPCVGFQVGGIPEMIDHLHNGYVAAYKETDDLANGILWTLTDPGYDSLCEAARLKVVTHYAETIVAERFAQLYEELKR